MPVFARNLMVHLFSADEMKECFNVIGRVRREPEEPNKTSGLDQVRIELIRRIVEENSLHDKQLWFVCLQIMNIQIRKTKTKHQL